ncbi:unnamed protein product [Dovyalis caffra]|uniref:Uncharacterized protein n=1 Tax=Dovyalis caffra TaxID=77055 RepID=A0AAV1SSJ1_9ROSI|nr:unnamed protein product [Dovyalis caffra]
MCYQQASTYGFCFFVGLSCVVFLIFVTYQDLKHGPDTVKPSLNISSLTFTELHLGTGNSKKLDVVWNASLNVFAKSPKPSASFRTNRGSFAVIKYKDFSVSCGELVEHEKELRMGVGNVATLQFQSEPCGFSNQMEEELGTQLSNDLNQKQVRLGLNLKFRFSFKNRAWSWANVLVTSFCDNLLIQSDTAQGQWLFKENGSSACKVNTPVIIQ